MSTVNSFFYFHDRTGLTLRQKYVTMEALLNQFHIEGSVSRKSRETFLFDNNFAVGMIIAGSLTKYLYSSSQIHSMTTGPVILGPWTFKTKQRLIETAKLMDSEFAVHYHNHPLYTPLTVNSSGVVGGIGAYPRHNDTEYKIFCTFHDWLHSINLVQTTGKVCIYTKLQPCPSCQKVAADFIGNFPNIDVNFYFDQQCY